MQLKLRKYMQATTVVSFDTSFWVPALLSASWTATKVMLRMNTLFLNTPCLHLQSFCVQLATCVTLNWAPQGKFGESLLHVMNRFCIMVLSSVNVKERKNAKDLNIKWKCPRGNYWSRWEHIKEVVIRRRKMKKTGEEGGVGKEEIVRKMIGNTSQPVFHPVSDHVDMYVYQHKHLTTVLSTWLVLQQTLTAVTEPSTYTIIKIHHSFTY